MLPLHRLPVYDCFVFRVAKVEVVCEISLSLSGARCSSVVKAFAHGAMDRRIDPSWGGPIELFLVPARASRLV